MPSVGLLIRWGYFLSFGVIGVAVVSSLFVTGKNPSTIPILSHIMPDESQSNLSYEVLVQVFFSDNVVNDNMKMSKWKNLFKDHQDRFKLQFIHNGDLGNAGFVIKEPLSSTSAAFIGYKKFIDEYPTAGWLYRTTSNTPVNVKNLRTYIERLTFVFKTEPIIKSFDTSGHFPESPGWIASRSYIQKRLEVGMKGKDEPIDISEWNFAKERFNVPEAIEDLALIGLPCPDCVDGVIKESKWEAFPICRKGTDDIFGTMRNIVALPLPGIENNYDDFINKLEKLPETIRFRVNKVNNLIEGCMLKNGKNIRGYDSQELFQRKEVLK